MRQIGYSWLSVHLARLLEAHPVSDFHTEGPLSAAEWRLLYDAPLGPDGWRVGEADVWGGLAFFESREQAEASLSGSENELPFSGLSSEGWHGLLAVTSHRGYVDYSLDGERAPVFKALDYDPGGALAVITSAGYESEDETQHDRIKEFSAQNEDVREFYTSLDSNILNLPFNMVGARDGMTFSIWSSERAMVEAAYSSGTHRGMIDVHRSRSMFDHSSWTRLRLLSSRGTWDGADPLLKVG